MGSLDNNIRLIRNETVEGGNTKERIAETFELLATELERKVNKDANKGLSSNDFSNEHKDKLEGLQQVDTSGLLQKGAYTGNASSLKADIDKKVDKVAGKGLSSNDYTNEEKQKNEENANKRVVSLTVTGDVNKIITLTFSDSTVIQAPFNDNDHIPLADVHMNSLNFNENTGVLTGVKSDGNEISVSLDGRYSLIGHNHDERYAPITHHHNEYAHRTHRHNWDDIDGKPNNLATAENVKTAIDGIQIGGRNLLLNSDQKITNKNYNIAKYQLTEELKDGEIFTVTIKGKLGAGKDVFAIYNSGDGVELSQLYNKGNNIHQNTFTWKKSYNSKTADNKTLWVWTYSGSVTAESTIEWIKLERGNKATDWSPAPEDLATTEEVMRKITRTGYEVSSDTVIPQAQQNDTVFVKASCTLGLQNIEHLGSVSFIKTFDTGAVTFTCAGKTIIMKGDTQFNGGKGSTAVVSIQNNDCYIRISNV